MSNLCGQPQASIEYPCHEWGKFIPTADTFPLQDILIGITNPFPTYSIDRKATNRFVLLECILSGEGKVWLDGKWKSVGPRDVVFFDKDSDQRYHADQNNPFRKIYLSFASDYVDTMIHAFGVALGFTMSTRRTSLKRFSRCLGRIRTTPSTPSFWPRM